MTERHSTASRFSSPRTAVAAVRRVLELIDGMGEDPAVILKAALEVVTSVREIAAEAGAQTADEPEVESCEQRGHHCGCWNWVADAPGANGRRPAARCCDCGIPNPRYRPDGPLSTREQIEQAKTLNASVTDMQTKVTAIATEMTRLRAVESAARAFVDAENRESDALRSSRNAADRAAGYNRFLAAVTDTERKRAALIVALAAMPVVA